MGIPSSLRAMHGDHRDKMTKGNLFSAELDLIEEEDGFNIGRDYEDPDVMAHIRKLADAYKAGEDIPPIKVVVVDGRILVREGHCRRRGALLARSEGAEITRLPLLEAKGDELEQNLIPLTSDDGLKLKPLGRAKIYARLINMGLTVDEVAQRIRMTKTIVQQYLDLMDLPMKLKEYINSGHISWSNALSLYKEQGTASVATVEKSLGIQGDESQVGDTPAGEANEPEQKAPAKKVKRVTGKDLDAAKGYRSRLTGKIVKDVTTGLGTIVSSLGAAREDEDGEHLLVRLTKADAEALKALHASVLPKDMEPAGDEESANDGETGSETIDETPAHSPRQSLFEPS